jgi:hypothetical protein
MREDEVPADSDRVEISDRDLSLAIFGPLWALGLLGALVHTNGIQDPFNSALGRYVSARRAVLDAFLGRVRLIGRFNVDVMEVAHSDAVWRDEAGPLPADQVVALVSLYSRLLEPAPISPSDLPAIRRSIRVAIDRQLVDMMHGLVLAAVERHPDDAVPIAEHIVAAAALAASFAGVTDPSIVEYAYRAWRVGHLCELLDPTSGATAQAKGRLRQHDRALESLLLGQA